jgi:SHS2 domain-containing protein
MLFVAWLDEILYRNEVHQQWLTEAHLRIEESIEGLEIVAQISWVNGSEIEREIEIKAVTTHELQVSQVDAGQTVPGGHEDVPDFVGPGWYANVVFDI